jgi:predicted CopG family antitoxin
MEEQNETMIRIKENAWKALNKRRMMGESFSETIVRLCLEFPEETTADKHEFAEDQLSACLSNKERMVKK